MTEAVLPLLLEVEQLEAVLKAARQNILLLDVCTEEEYAQGHVPGAIHIHPAMLQSGVAPAIGKLPDLDKLQELFSSIGLNRGQHVVAMDHEGGGWAGRLIWTLDALDHPEYSFFNGGFNAWSAAGKVCSQRTPEITATEYRAEIVPGPIIQLEDLVSRLEDTDFAVWDARSAREFSGEKVTAQRAGHIPGAVNLDWLELIDRDRDLRLVDLDQLREKLNGLGLTADKEIATHCHTHHRSSLAYLVMKLLGYPSIKGYDGSWSEWGNREDTPIELPG